MSTYVVIENNSVLMEYDSYDEAVAASQYDANDSGNAVELYQKVCSIQPEANANDLGLIAGKDYPATLGR